MDFEEQLAIGGEENAPKEYLFGGPEFIETDSKNRIYIATVNNTIRIFSPEGKYLKTIGGRGRGPGEFLSITTMTMGFNDEIFVYDIRLRRLTTFYNVGDSVTTESFTNPYWVGHTFVPLDDGTFAITTPPLPPSANEFMSDYEPISEGNNVIYLLNRDLSERTRSFFDPYKYMFDKNIPIENKFATESDYRLARLNDSTLAITHVISDGKIYLVNRNRGDIREIEGRFSNQESYEQLPYENRHDYITTHFGLVTGGGFAYQRKLESLAFLTNDKWLLNFVMTTEKNEYTIGIEFLDKKGNYLGYTSIEDDFTIVQNQYSDFLGGDIMKIQFYPLHLDDRNRLHYMDMSSEVPVIRITKITMNE